MLTGKAMIVLALAASVTLSACSRGDKGMMNLRASTTGPDEFAVLPTKPITMPKSYDVLPAPTPGGSNATDPTPIADATKALGGNPKRLSKAGVPRADAGLVTAATRYGVGSDIRTVLASEDLEFRRKHRGRLFERMFGVTVYFSSYSPQMLDRYLELKRLRAAGVRTPAAPPQ